MSPNKKIVWKNLVAVCAVVFSVGAAHAGEKEGNGGDAVVLRKRTNPDRIISAELLEYFEAKTYGLKLDLGPASLSVRKKVELLLKRYAVIYPHETEKLSKETEVLLGAIEAHRPGKDSRLGPVQIAALDLVDIPDSNHIKMCHGCKVEQLVVRQDQVTPDAPEYTINRLIFDQLDRDSQAGTILHEAIYKAAASRGESNSIRSRHLNYVLATRPLETMTPKELIDIVQQLSGIEFALVQKGFSIDVREPSDLEFYPNGQVKKAPFYFRGGITSIDLDGDRKFTLGKIILSEQIVEARISYSNLMLEFSPIGEIERIYDSRCIKYKNDPWHNDHVGFILETKHYRVSGSNLDLRFYKNHELKELSAKAEIYFQDGQSPTGVGLIIGLETGYNGKVSGRATFDEQGQITSLSGSVTCFREWPGSGYVIPCPVMK